MILPRIRHFINIYLVTCVGDPNCLFRVFGVFFTQKLTV